MSGEELPLVTSPRQALQPRLRPSNCDFGTERPLLYLQLNPRAAQRRQKVDLLQTASDEYRCRVRDQAQQPTRVRVFPAIER